MKNLSWTPNHSDSNEWKARHLRAVPVHPVGKAIGAWIDYARDHQIRFGSNIGEDYVLGDAWARWGFALRELLNGELAGMDAGTLDSILADNLQEQGFDPDTEERTTQ